MRELIAYYPQGTVVYRFDGRIFYVKGANSNPRVKQITDKLKSWGATFQTSKGWIKGDLSEVTIKGMEDSDDKEIEEALVNLYTIMFEKSKTKYEVNML